MARPASFFKAAPAPLKPITLLLISREPAFDVIIKTTFLKSAALPVLSVIVAWSITCRRALNRSGCAFSISSSNNTQCGFFRIVSVNRAPWSKPTYPGGEPSNLEILCFSIYSLISKRTSSTPSCCANLLESSVLPTPVGPTNRKEPTGFSVLPRPERCLLMAFEIIPTAFSCPNTTSLRRASRSRRFTLSLWDKASNGTRAILAMSFSMSETETVLFSGWYTDIEAPASSITSIALSGKNRSFRYFADNSTALRRAFLEYLTLWKSS